MKVSELLGIYENDSHIQLLKQKLQERGTNNLFLKGLSGSLDAVLAAALAKTSSQTQVFVLNDKDEAYFFQNDLQQLLGQPVFVFPASYKKPYHYEQVENANILQRAETLNHIVNNQDKPSYIVTYPLALSEKVINKRSLVENTFIARVGEKLNREFMEEFLQSYSFERNDFAYEAGQYAIRGGIIDIFSYSNEFPYRIELFGDEIESIRTFNPESQLSIATIPVLSITPNVQTRLLKEEREALFTFLPEDTLIWIKDYTLTTEVIEESFSKVEAQFDTILAASGNSALITSPDALFENKTSFKKSIEHFSIIEFGSQSHISGSEKIEIESKPQPSFNKEFNMLLDDLKLRINQGYKIIIASESHQQIQRLHSILEELDPYLRFDELISPLREGFIDIQRNVLCYTDHQIFDRFHRYKTKERFSKSKSITLKELRTLQPGDFVAHSDFGIARFAGLERIENNGHAQEAIRLVFRDDDLMVVSIHALHKISRYSGKDGQPPLMSKLGSADWENKKSKVKRQVKDIAKELIQLYAKRKAAPGFAYSPDSFLQVELESSFMYEDTPDQSKATADVKKDMQSPHPMDRLVCGDVGFGKTEIAVRAAFKAVCDGKQVAILVPTTILAMQHYKTFRDRLSKFPCVVEYINRFKTAAQIKETLKRVKEGKTDILIGTHRVISKDVEFKNVGLLIIDEEQKFGVKVKEKLREFKINIDTLTLTATPIPRTLHFSLMGARDLSIIATPPPNRQPVTTEIHVFDEAFIRDAVAFELKRGGQVFFVYNRVRDIEGMAFLIKKLVPDARVTFAHGQMEGDKLEEVMLKFVEGEYDVLVSTNIIESGLDIPNANTIIINSAHMFGLSDLHQMRGRVGRSNKKAFCYLLTPSVAALTGDSRKRLSVLEEFSDLGDGFKVAMRDLDIRGAGNMLGAEQSGFITDLGFDMYHKILDEAIQELKETEFADLFKNELDQQRLKNLVQDCVIETDLSILIPETYVNNISERLSLYSTIDNIKNEIELNEFITSLKDRFGPLPKEVIDLTETIRLRWLAQELGFEKLTIKSGIMRCQFVPSERTSYYTSDVFGTILTFVQTHSKNCKMKELNKKLILIISEIQSIEQGLQILKEIQKPIVVSK
ncbi:transcription-repair coupling factor [Cytophaga aurantiaca]|uniref:transcription-repair coupling factor n=1 Tax=Cytophaga aurantiaca TaxID=29530 RepID=UPI00037020E8|nr:transcription-repair coupling factor [Cytophaga aurantiaca]